MPNVPASVFCAEILAAVLNKPITEEREKKMDKVTSRAVFTVAINTLWRFLGRVTATAFVLFAVTLPQPVQAATFRCASGDVSCLTASINEANANGHKNTIRLEAGTYTLMGVDNFTNGPTGLPSIISTLTIEGARDDTTTIARPSGAPSFRFLTVEQTGNLTLDRVNLTGGVGGPGGALSNIGGVLNIVRSTISQNSGGGGSALFNNAGTVNINRSTFAENFALFGPALVTAGGIVRITQSRFTLNTNLEGGPAGLEAAGGTVFITTSTFDGNQSPFVGSGAVLVDNQATLVVTDSSFTRNVGVVGPGILNSGGSVFVTNTTFARNSLSPGFGLFPVPAGAIQNSSGSLFLLNSTLAENTATQPNPFFALGATLLSGASATTLVQNTIIARILQGVQDCAGPIRSLGNNLIGDVTGCSIILQPSDLIGDPGLGQYTDNGNPGNGHFPLLPTSPAIDAANDAPCPQKDQIGQPRRPRCDIGAIEFRHPRDDSQHDEDPGAPTQEREGSRQ
jgi:hypothetical protein